MLLHIVKAIKMKKLPLFTACLILSTPCSAYTCTGSIKRLSISSSGDIYLDIGNDMMMICGTAIVRDIVSIDACKNYYSMLLTAKASSRAVTLFFDPGNSSIGGITQCDNLGSWQIRTPYLVEFAY